MIVYDDIKNIKGVGDKTAHLFNKIGVYNINDLIHCYPRNYIKYDRIVNLKDASLDTPSAFYLTIKNDFSWKKTKRNLSFAQGYATDGHDDVFITFFNTPYYKKVLVKDAKLVFYGKLQKDTIFRLEHPKFFKKEEYMSLEGMLQPVYPLTKGLTNNAVIKAVKTSLEEDDYFSLYNEYLPQWILDEFELESYNEALKNIHFPNSMEEYERARRRLSFNELFSFLFMLKLIKGNGLEEESEYDFIETSNVKRLIEELPYKLTNAQDKVINEIINDMLSGKVMNRLIQGDVGSGKTIVAFLSMLFCVSNSYQTALMAPTEILAIQHYNNLSELTGKYKLPFKLALLTGSTSAKDKKEIYENIKNGVINAVIGTHAVIQDKVEFKNLALVVTDEQHRFGVRQRKTLTDKGGKPHVLVMSATPIPRTLAMVLYGDLHISVIDEKPSNRLEIKNCVVDRSYRPTAYKFIYKEIKEGRQVYIICPMVEESEGMNDVENVVDYTERLKDILPNDVRIEYIHGQMKNDLKDRIMNSFIDHNIDILVSTTVIEVGIDVPNATVVMIENAERFGLSQLHQLRGRVGRGDKQSYAIFVNGQNKDNKRLEILNKTNDGFILAKEDLKLRGAGDIFGIRQSGNLDFEIADIYADSDMIFKINNMLDEIFKSDPDLKNERNARLKEFALENTNKSVDFGTI